MSDTIQAAVSCEASDAAPVNNKGAAAVSSNQARAKRDKLNISHLCFLGFGLYWTWVYLSFNSAPVVQFSHGSETAITWLHVISGLAGCVTFAAVMIFHERMEQTPRANTMLWAAATMASFGSMFYATQVISDAGTSLLLGAILPGLATPIIALGWGVVMCTLDARLSAAFTAGSFFLAGVLYWLISLLSEPLSGVIVAFLPLATVFFMVLCPTRTAHPFTLHRPKNYASQEAKSSATEQDRTTAFQNLRQLIAGPFSSRALVGILLTMVVSGGLRTYVGMQAPDVYNQPLIVAVSNGVVALAFLIYSAFLPHTSLRLGPLYRLAAPLFALGIAALTVFATPSSSVSYFAASAGSELIDMLTWVLLIEIARSSRFSALLIFAVGRFVIHLGMAVGELVSLAVPAGVIPFEVISIVALIIIAGFMFSDRDEALVFEPVAVGEIDFADVEPDAAAIALPVVDSEEARAAAMDARIATLSDAYGLTAREAEVFTLWATGHGAKSIEEKLVLSSATVRTHVRHIYEKLDIHSRAELIDLLEHTK